MGTSCSRNYNIDSTKINTLNKDVNPTDGVVADYEEKESNQRVSSLVHSTEKQPQSATTNIRDGAVGLSSNNEVYEQSSSVAAEEVAKKEEKSSDYETEGKETVKVAGHGQSSTTDKDANDTDGLPTEEIHTVVEQCWKNVHSTCENDITSQDNTQDEETDKKKHRGWTVVRVFVSSTFSDYHAEREMLVKNVFPALREWCEGRMIHLIEVDLRWGVPKDSTSENTIRICMEELDRCRQETDDCPFFINMVGQRFGWMPSNDDMSDELINQYQWIFPLSITTMEIMHGAFRKKNPNAVFFVRQSDFLQELPQQFNPQFVEQTALGLEQLKALKSELKDRFSSEQVLVYSCQYDGVDDSSGTNKVRLKGLNEFCHQTVAFFKERIEKTYPVIHEAMSQTEIEMASHWTYVENRGRTFLGRDEELDQVMNYCLSHQSSENTEMYPLVVLGVDGHGKSSLLARCTLNLKKEEGLHVFFFFIGSSSNSTSSFNVLNYLCSFLSKVIQGETVDFSEKSKDELSRLLKSFLEDAEKQQDKNIVLILDSLHLLSDIDSTDHLNWLPEKLPENVRCILSVMTGSFSAKRLLQRPGLEDRQVVLGDLNPETRQKIAKETLKIYNKELDSEQMELLVSHSGAASPMWLTNACEELRVFGVFEQVTQRIKDFPDDLKGLSRVILERIVSEDETGCISKTLALLYCSLSGLSEDELKWLLSDSEEDHIPMMTWSLVRSKLKSFLGFVGGNRGQEKYSFSHPCIKEAVQQLILAVPEEEKKWRCLLADYFDKKCSDIYRTTEELPYQLKKTGQFERLVTFMRKDDRAMKISSFDKAGMFKTMRCQTMITGNKPQFEFPAYICNFCMNRTRGFGQVYPNKTSCVVCGFPVHIRQERNQAFYCFQHRVSYAQDTTKCIVCEKVIFFNNKNLAYEKCYTCHFCFHGMNRCVHINV